MATKFYDWAWTGRKGRCHWAPIESFQMIKRGRKKGFVRIVLTDAKRTKRIIPSEHLRLNPRIEI